MTECHIPYQAAYVPLLADVSAMFGDPTAVPNPWPSRVELVDLFAGTPNPWRPGFPVRFDLPEAGRVQVSLYDVRGRLVRTLLDESSTAGVNTVFFEDIRVSSGVHFLVLTRPGRRNCIKKLIILK